MMGFLGPIAMFAGYALGLIANGIVITLFKARVPKLGALALTGFIVGLLMFVMGHPWVVIIVAPVLGLLGDLCYAKNIKIMRILGYAIFSLWYVTPCLPRIHSEIHGRGLCPIPGVVPGPDDDLPVGPGRFRAGLDWRALW